VPGTTLTAARIAWILTAALAVFVAWLATDFGGNAGLAFLYAVPVGLAAWWDGWRAAAPTVAACLLLYAIGASLQPVPDFGAAFAVRLVVLGGVALFVSLLHERLVILEHSAEELEAIRAALAPSTLPELPGVDAAAAFVPSELGVSGDFYLLTNGPDGSTVAIVGDVVGHGPEAAQLATFVRARFAAFAANTSDPAELLTLANGALVDRPGRRRELVSAACLRYLGEVGQLSWAVAGHPPPLRLPGLGELQAPGTTFLLGAKANLVLRNADVSLDAGDGVLIYTDGATDVRQAGSLLGLEGLTRLLAPLTSLPARAVVQQAEEAILDWADGPIRDDLCLLVLKPQRLPA